MDKVAPSSEGISIIIISYNDLYGTTAPCLQSIFENTDHGDFDVIVVDNNSSDGTQEYLLDLASREPRLKCILNQINRGFAGGNNDAIRVAEGRYLILLNSDTRVSKGWLSRIVAELKADPSLGLVGPVSNATGNEQTIFTVGTTPEEILAAGSAWTEMSSGDSFPMKRLSFFCVATRRDVIDRVGLLDEAYGLGFYEDDDYCLRVRNAGFRLACREDVFVYHQGSASFGKTPQSTKLLLKKNKRLLEKKFGLSNYRTDHPRDRLLELIAACLELTEMTGPDEKSKYKIINRLRVLEKLRPRGLFKRIFFDRKVRRLKSKLKAGL